MIKEQLKRFLSKENEYRKLFETDLGKKVLLDLMRQYHVLETSFSKDPYETAFKEGMRHVILVILNRVNKDHSDLVKLVKEGETNDRSDNRYFGGSNTIHNFDS